MSNTWPPPEGGAPIPPAWGPPLGQPAPDGRQQYPPPQYPQPQYPQPQYPQQPPNYGWPPQNGYGAPHKTVDDKLFEWTVPINRSGLAIGAGYAALCSFPILIAAPVGVLLGILALRDIARNPHKLGKGRAWFAIVYGGLGTVALAWVVVAAVAALASR